MDKILDEVSTAIHGGGAAVNVKITGSTGTFFVGIKGLPPKKELAFLPQEIYDIFMFWLT